MALEIVRNDITRMKVDAIVNTANPRPVIGTGTDAAVHHAAGPELLKARQAIGRIQCGESAITPAFGLDARYVIHTVSPIWTDGKHHEKELLQKAYEGALNLAHEYHCKSIAFPLMAAGNYGFSHDLALSVAIRTCTDFLLTHHMHIYIVVFHGKAYQLSKQLVADVKSFIDEHYVEKQNRTEYRNWRPEHRRRLEQELIYGQQVPEAMPSISAAPNAYHDDDLEGLQEDLHDWLDKQQETFSDTLRRIICEKDLRDTEVYLPIGMNRTTFHRIKNSKTCRPKRETTLQLAFALHLNLDQTQDFIGKAGYVLSHSSKWDIVLEYCLQTKKYNPIEVDGLLVEMGEKALFSLA